MHFHLPKPMHGWRAFVGEVGIIVLGVLIALGAEQLLSRLHDRQVAAETRAAITSELNDDLASIALRRLAEPCVERRLAELRTILNQWARTGTFTTPLWVAQTPKIEVTLTRLEAAASAGRLALLPNEEQYRIGAVAEGIRRFDKQQTEERLIWGRLRALQAGPSGLNAADRTMLLTALQDASVLNYETEVDEHQIDPMAKDFGYAADFKHIRAVSGRVWTAGRYSPSICTSINTPREDANKTQVTPLPL